MSQPSVRTSGGTGPFRSATSENGLLQFVSMAAALIFRAVAQERDSTLSRELLDQAERELLTMILDGGAPRVNRAVHEQFAPVLTEKPGPRDAAGLDVPQETFAWSQRRHPHVVAARWHPAPAEPRGENPDSIALAIDGARNGLRPQHRDYQVTRLPDYPITRLPDYPIQKIAVIDAAARSRTRAGRMPR